MSQNSPLTVAVFLRADEAVGQRRDSILHRLNEFKNKRRIDRFERHAWPRSICLDTGEDVGWKPVLDTVRSFETWAIKHGIGLRPPFAIRRMDSSITGEQNRRIVLPVVCLAAYEGDELIGVFPCTCGGRAYTVKDALDLIEGGSLAESAAVHRPAQHESTDPEEKPGPADTPPPPAGDGTMVALYATREEGDE